MPPARRRVLVNTVGRRPRGRWLADIKAEAFAWWVSVSSDQRLQSLMDSHLRAVLLWQIFRTIRQRARPEERINAVVEFRITGRGDGGIDRYRLRLADGRCRTSRHDGPPALTLELGPVALLRLVSGTASPAGLLLTGKLKLRGGMLLALALPTALRIPRRRARKRSGKR